MKKILYLSCILFFCGHVFSQEAKPCPGVLINGVCWAKSNVDKPGTFASTPEAWGMLYQWNRKKAWAHNTDTTGWDDTDADGEYWDASNTPCPYGWKIPTQEDLNSIKDCYKREGYVLKITDPTTGNIIIIPRTPTRGYYGTYYEEFSWFYWVNSAYDNDEAFAATYVPYLRVTTLPKKFAYPVRCVADWNVPKCKDIKRDTSVTICAKDLPYDFCDTTFEEGTMSGTYVFQRIQALTGCDSIVTLNLTVKSECDKPCPGVLINGVCWAKSNVDKPGSFASTPEAFGMLYQWNRKKAWPHNTEATGWDNTNAPGDYWETINNPCPKGWRVPNEEEINSIKDCDYVSENYICKFTDPNSGNTMVIPRTSRRNERGEYSEDYIWCYWVISAYNQYYAFTISNVPYIRLRELPKNWGLPIRCVADWNVQECKDIKRDTSVTICAKDLPYEFCDTTFEKGTVSGTYIFQGIQALTGCDSIVTLNLTVKPECDKPCPGVLINGVCWAEYDVDEPGKFANAAKPYGMLYQWNRKKAWPVRGEVTGWDNSVDPAENWESDNDPCPAGWRMPTAKELETLSDESKVTYTETVQNGFWGSRFRDNTTGATIFLSNIEFRSQDGELHGMETYYWSSSSRWYLQQKWMRQGSTKPPSFGFPIRCVANEKNDNIVLALSETICQEKLPYPWRDTTFGIGTKTGEYCFRRTRQGTTCDSIVYLHLTIDTTCNRPCKNGGIRINGVCWAEYNVNEPGTFAFTPEAWGMLYQWNRKKGWPATGTVSDWDDSNPDGTNWETANDPCPKGWRVPSIIEMNSLLDNQKVTHEYIQQKGIYGSLFTDNITGNTIFLPKINSRHSASDPENRSLSYYWSSSVDLLEETELSYNDAGAWTLYLYTTPRPFLFDKSSASSIRCVTDWGERECEDIRRDTSVTICTKDLPYDFCDTTFEKGTVSGTYVFRCQALTGCDSIVTLKLTVTPDCNKPCPGVLINGVCWAKSNVDKPGTFASTPEAFGMLYQWNRKKGWPHNADTTGWDNTNASGDYWETSNDPCPHGWRVPTKEEMNSIKDYYVREGDVLKITDPTTGNTMIMPYTPTLINNGMYDSTLRWFYWTNAAVYAHSAYVAISHPLFCLMDFPKKWAFSVRCVADWNVQECKDIKRDTSVTICAKDLPYNFCDTTFEKGTVSGTYIFQGIQALTGCDSIVTLKLTVTSDCDKPCPGVLINGVCWAKYNVDELGKFANPDKPHGMLYQWNRKKGWPALEPDTIKGWDNSLEPGDAWKPENDPCPAGWRMPTVEEMRTLSDKNKVIRRQSAQDGMDGERVWDIATGNTMFLPHTYYYRDSNGVLVSSYNKILYWSASDYWHLERSGLDQTHLDQTRFPFGYAIRCVADSNANAIVLHVFDTICREKLPYQWRDTTFDIGTKTGEYIFRKTRKGTQHDSIVQLYLTVDMLCGKPCHKDGVLINGVCWAKSNVDQPGRFAATPESSGMLYRWDCRTGYPLRETHWEGDSKSEHWKALNNPCPVDWHIPSLKELISLMDDTKVSYEWTHQNGVKGGRFTDLSNGNTIFLPAAGLLHNSGLTVNIGVADYWSSTWDKYPYPTTGAKVMALASGKIVNYNIYTALQSAHSVRCVVGRDTTGCITTKMDTIVKLCVSGLPYHFGDTTFQEGTESGQYFFKRRSKITGCDSLVTLFLTVLPASDTTLYDSICQGNGYQNHGFSLDAAQFPQEGTYSFSRTERNIYDCDSVIHLHLTVHPVYDMTFLGEVCQGGSYSKDGFIVPPATKDTIVRQEFKTRWGCDSVRILDLRVHPVYDTIVRDTVCQGESYNKHGASIDYAQPSGAGKPFTVTHPYESIHGCDSLVTLFLTVHPISDTILYDSICQGDGYRNHGFSLDAAQFSKEGTYSFSRKERNTYGCDSTVTLLLTVHPVNDTTLYDAICQGNGYQNHGFKLDAAQFPKGGTYSFSRTERNMHDCDSVIHLHLTVHPAYDMAFFGEVCQGKSYNEDGFFVASATKDTVVRQELKTHHQCDSVRTLYLTVHPVYDTVVYDTVCQGNPYYRHGVSISHAQRSGDGKPAMYRKTYPSVHGCDSTVTLFLTVHPTSDTTLYDAICQGDGYRNHGFSLDAAHFPKEGTYSFSRKERNMHGCDSTITLSLTVHPDYTFPRTEHICQGETFEFRDKVYDATGLYADRLETAHGCDSVYTLSLTVHPVYDVRLEGVFCEGEAFTRYGFDVREAGVHVLHLRSVDGCDSTVTLTLTEEKKVEGSIGFLLEDCTKHGYGFAFSPSIPVREWVWDMGDGTAYRTEEGYHRYADSGTYRVLLRTLTDNGCGNEFLHVQRVPPYLDRVTVHADRQVVDEEYPTVRFRAEVLPGMECEWDFGDGTTGKGSGTEHTYATTEARVYEVTLRVTNEDGCLTESTLDIEAVVFPKAVNTFSPNGDGINDVFMAGFRIEIMNRNGLKIYSGGKGWDGTYKGGEAKEDTYFYRVTFRTATGERTKTGYVNLIR